MPHVALTSVDPRGIIFPATFVSVGVVGTGLREFGGRSLG